MITNKTHLTFMH